MEEITAGLQWDVLQYKKIVFQAPQSASCEIVYFFVQTLRVIPYGTINSDSSIAHSSDVAGRVSLASAITPKRGDFQTLKPIINNLGKFPSFHSGD